MSPTVPSRGTKPATVTLPEPVRIPLPMTLRRAREVLRRLVGLDKLNRVARLTGALQEICRLDPREGYTLSDAARIAEDGLANPPDYIWPVRSEPERRGTCTCRHDEANHATHGLRSCCRSTAEGECDCPGFTAQKSEPEPDEAKEQAISDLLEKIANLPGITPEDLELLEEITGNGK
jgi:hypothetical protein